ncbi:MAG TPA: hypothetical protein VMI94_06195 [Bryobacteraceae bacterium]|nr:hypothetical protein [Bryobacteraceae bacterium]
MREPQMGVYQAERYGEILIMGRFNERHLVVIPVDCDRRAQGQTPGRQRGQSGGAVYPTGTGAQ